VLPICGKSGHARDLTGALECLIVQDRGLVASSPRESCCVFSEDVAAECLWCAEVASGRHVEQRESAIG